MPLFMRYIILKSKQWQQLFCSKNTPLQYLDSFNGVNICVKRDDLNHEIVQGNKLRKLKYNFKYALENDYQELITFGGAFSNHILALAQASNLCGLNCTGFIRGDELSGAKNKWSSTLKLAESLGMKLKFVSRADYRHKLSSSTVKAYLHDLKNKAYYIPEGGSNARALLGVKEIITELKAASFVPTHIITACGTGGTLAGLIDGVVENGWKTMLIGIPVLKGAQFIEKKIERLAYNHRSSSWQLYHNYHAGGYAKINKETLDFGKKFNQKNNIPLDKIYTAKTFYATYDLIRQGVIKINSSVLIIHTGGLQGGAI